MPTKAVAASQTKKTVKRDIAIVFDNSGSMYMGGNKAWCQATYAMEVFASMMNEGDVLRIYPMSEIEVDGKKYDSASPLLIGDPGKAQEIRKIYTPKGGDTFVSTIDAAYNGLIQSKADEQWLIVLTDGEVFYEPDTVQLSAAETKVRLSEVLSNYASRVNILYLGIGSVAAVPEITGRLAHAPQTAASAEVPRKLSEMCNTIFGRDALPEANKTGSSVTFDIPLSKLIIFAQGENIGAVKFGSEKATATLSPKASDLGAGNYAGRFGTAPELQGIISTYENNPAGTYDLTFDGHPDDVEIYYEPDADLQVQLLDSAGNPVNTGAGVFSGDYKLIYRMTDSEGNDISESPLLGKTAYSADITHNGQPVALASADKAGSVDITLKSGDTLDVSSASVTFLNDYTINKTGEELEFPSGGLKIQKPDSTMVLKVGGGRDAYPMSKLEDEAVYEVRALKDGKELDASQFEKMIFDRMAVTGGEIPEGGGNPLAECRIDGNKLVIQLKYNTDAAHTAAGEQSFTVNASYTDPYGDMSSASIDVPFTIEADGEALDVVLSILKGYYVQSELGGPDTPLIAKVTLNGEPLTDEQLRMTSEQGLIRFKTDDRLALADEVRPLYGESAFSVDLMKEGTETGMHRVTCTVDMPPSINKVYKTGENDGYVSISRLPRWLFWLIIGLALLLLALLILLIMNKKILPKDIFVKQGETEFSSNGEQVTGFKQIRYMRKSIFGRIFSKETSIVLMSVSDAEGKSISPVRVKLRSIAKVKDVLFAPRQCRLQGILVEPSGTVSSLSISGVNFQYDENERKFVDDVGKPAPNRPFKIGNGSPVEINEVVNGFKGNTYLNYTTKLHIKW